MARAADEVCVAGTHQQTRHACAFRSLRALVSHSCAVTYEFVRRGRGAVRGSRLLEAARAAPTAPRRAYSLRSPRYAFVRCVACSAASETTAPA